MTRAYFFALFAAVVFGGSLWCGCGDDAKHDERPPPHAARPLTPPAALPAHRVSSAAPSPHSLTEGAPTPELVFARAQEALEKHDYAAFVGSIRPETRRRWLTDLLLAVALASGDEPLQSDETARRKGEMRTLLMRRGATASVAKPSQVSVADLQKILLEKVADPDELMVALLDFAAAHGAELDPVRALDPSAGPSAASASMLRLANRVRAPHRMAVELPVASSVPASADPQALEDALMPVRFRTEGGVSWLDET
jgi:hypothetical protein